MRIQLHHLIRFCRKIWKKACNNENCIADLQADNSVHPRAYGAFDPDTSPTLAVNNGFSGISRQSTGLYRCTFSTAFSDTSYVVLTSFSDLQGKDFTVGYSKSTTHVDLYITDVPNNSASDAPEEVSCLVYYHSN